MFQDIEVILYVVILSLRRNTYKVYLQTALVFGKCMLYYIQGIP